MTFVLPYVIIISMMMKIQGKKYFQNHQREDGRFKDSERTFRVGQLWEVHHEVVRRLALGEKGSDIAESLGVSKAMVSYTKNSKLARDKIDIMRAAMDADTVDVGIRIQEIAPKALEVLEGIIQGSGEYKEASLALRARYADKHLDRAGYSPVKKLAVATQHLTKEDIEKIKERAIASAMESGVVDISPRVKMMKEGGM